jgi:hypothetical protein
MNTAAIRGRYVEAGAESVREFGRDSVAQWSALCQQFLDNQRHVLSGRITRDQLQDHLTALKWLLRFARVMHVAVSDPDYPDRQIADELEGRLIQLEHSWELFHNPMSEAEAENLIADVFPA